MTPPVPISTPIDKADLARIDVLAKSYGVSREEMIISLLHIGLPLCEREAPERVNVVVPSDPDSRAVD